MVQPSGPANTPRPDLSVLIEFPDAFNYLRPVMMAYCEDKDPSFVDAILRLIVKDVLDYANQWAESNSLEYAVEVLQSAGAPTEAAYEMAKNTQDLISAKMSLLLPDFTVSRFSGKYMYTFIGGPYGRILFNYWNNGVPGGGRQPPGPEIVFS